MVRHYLNFTRSFSSSLQEEFELNVMQFLKKKERVLGFTLKDKSIYLTPSPTCPSSTFLAVLAIHIVSPSLFCCN
jgi:hypothetical protein